MKQDPSISIFQQLRRKEIETAKLRRKLWRAQNIDSLTKLLSFSAFKRKLRIRWRQANDTRQWLVLLFTDMDGLKVINLKKSYKAGTASIICISKTLKLFFGRRMDVIGRHGKAADEFLAVAFVDDPATASLTAESLIEGTRKSHTNSSRRMRRARQR